MHARKPWKNKTKIPKKYKYTCVLTKAWVLFEKVYYYSLFVSVRETRRVLDTAEFIAFPSADYLIRASRHANKFSERKKCEKTILNFFYDFGCLWWFKLSWN